MTAGQIPVADGAGGWLCGELAATAPRLVLVDSLGQEIGTVIDRIDVETTRLPRLYPAGVTLAVEVIGTGGQPITALFNASSTRITGNIQGPNDETSGFGVEVFFADDSCTDAYISLQSPLTPSNMVAALTASSPSPGGVCCDPAPATTLYIAELGDVVTLTQPFLINDWGGCFPFGGTPTGLPATASIDLTGFVPHLPSR